jgi:hypothetical protein
MLLITHPPCRFAILSPMHEPQLWRLEGGDTERAAWEDSKATRLEQIVGGHRGRSRCAPRRKSNSRVTGPLGSTTFEGTGWPSNSSIDLSTGPWRWWHSPPHHFSAALTFANTLMWSGSPEGLLVLT